ncbi:MAG: hypothetical protein F6J98_13765 [Moorea sp. SIO4G2]|nr:hypothetical protein [Moorena sp. SIO4G2]
MKVNLQPSTFNLQPSTFNLPYGNAKGEQPSLNRPYGNAKGEQPSTKFHNYSLHQLNNFKGHEDAENNCH